MQEKQKALAIQPDAPNEEGSSQENQNTYCNHSKQINEHNTYTHSMQASLAPRTYKRKNVAWYQLFAHVTGSPEKPGDLVESAYVWKWFVKLKRIRPFSFHIVKVEAFAGSVFYAL